LLAASCNSRRGIFPGSVEWKEISGVRFPTHRVNYLSGMKRGEVTTSGIRVNVGLRQQDLAAKPGDFAPDIPR
jgi:hypothetical protein